MTRDQSNSIVSTVERAISDWSEGPILLYGWIGLLFLAHRDALGFHGRSGVIDPIESFFFEAGATVPALHYAAFVYVIWARRHALGGSSPQESAPFASIFLALLGCSLFVWSRRVDQPDLLIDSLTLLVAAGSLWIGGWRRLGQFALPLAILWLARPWPPMVLHAIHEWLQTMTGNIAVLVLSPFGIVETSGHILNFRAQNFQVIEGCSGLRSTMTLIFGTLVYADLFSRSRGQTIAILVFAAILGLGVNSLRVIAIMLAPGADASSDHSIQGLIMISFGIVLVGGVDALGDRYFWPKGDRAWRRPAISQGTGSLIGRASWAPPIVLAGLLVVVGFTPIVQEKPESVIWRLHEIRREMGPWSLARVLEVDHDHMGSVDFRDKLYREYVRGDDHVFLFVGADDRRRRDQSSLSPKTTVPGSGWETIESNLVKLSDSDRTVARLRQRRGPEEALSFHFRPGAKGLLAESLRWVVALDLRSGQRPAEFAVVRVTAPIIGGDIERAHRTLSQFMLELDGDLDRARPSESH